MRLKEPSKRFLEDAGFREQCAWVEDDYESVKAPVPTQTARKPTQATVAGQIGATQTTTARLTVVLVLIDG